MNRTVHYEYPSPDPDATCDFFANVIGWTFQSWEGPQEYHLATIGEGDGINEGIMRVPDNQPRIVNTFEVHSVDELAKNVQAAGGQIVVPTMAIPGIGRVAEGLNPVGVHFGIDTHDPQAK